MIRSVTKLTNLLHVGKEIGLNYVYIGEGEGYKPSVTIPVVHQYNTDSEPCAQMARYAAQDGVCNFARQHIITSLLLVGSFSVIAQRYNSLYVVLREQEA
jgi:hypothetical protein